MLDKHKAQQDQQEQFSYRRGAIEEDYEVGKELGSGQFAVVKRLKHRRTGQSFAGKYIRKRKAKSSRKETIQNT